MKYTDHIVIERPLEKVFLWMFQPQHIAQLVTSDPTKDIESYGPPSPDPHLPARPTYLDDPSYIAYTAKMQRFLEQAESKMEIESLSTPTLHAGTTFQYSLGLRSRSKELPEFPEFPAWDPVTSGSITITKSVPPTFFAFTTRRSSYSENHSLAFQAQQGRTTITYTLTRFRMIEFIMTIASPLVSKSIPARNRVVALGNESIRRQLLHLKIQMEDEIDEV
jgi:hypothetical protein